MKRKLKKKKWWSVRTYQDQQLRSRPQGRKEQCTLSCWCWFETGVSILLDECEISCFIYFDIEDHVYLLLIWETCLVVSVVSWTVFCSECSLVSWTGTTRPRLAMDTTQHDISSVWFNQTPVHSIAEIENIFMSWRNRKTSYYVLEN